MSRTRAKREISQEEFVRQIKEANVVADSSSRLRDEAPGAYKDLGEVMQQQTTLVDIQRRLLPLVNVKGY